MSVYGQSEENVRFKQVAKDMYEHTASTEHMMAASEGNCVMYLEAVTDGDMLEATERVRRVIHRNPGREIVRLMISSVNQNVQAFELARYEIGIFRMKMTVDSEVTG